MRITRRFHACVDYTHGDTTVIVDPGSFETPENLDSADAVLITHIHPDHVDAAALDAAKTKNPALAIYGPAELAEHLSSEYTVVADGDTFTVGEITVETFETPHGTITSFIPLPENLGFILNGTVFQTGDSFPRLSERLRGVETVLIPVSAPWLKMLDVDTYLGESKPPRFIGIHDGIDNDNGVTLRTGLLTKLAQHHDLEFTPLRPGESVEV
ncbi:MBL fold metallo-hydrolase [Corynebacterium guangdongense]|uniref:L-ascorbate metabolism protein UlaG (Beta-lactamase superfamily) n=1 Tax=Corynebacterium guangdongense TaxID=1783348 RepID=A0ABU1ZVL3_9CORY|nr:MBL fold metallo-hydrolase [Corynebacterium guangdongense]MDR7328974.1 L-ascorbate metabolism protein UlaG (beta-lactamase superfamily) [Corynebacterium guangdongense]